MTRPRIVALALALAGSAAVAAPATATDVRVRVDNDAAPSVRIVSPADGARLPAGVPAAVRVESRDGERLWATVNGRRAWSVRADVIQGAWAPEPGPSRIVAVAERDGAPDAIAVAVVVGVAAGPAQAGAPPAPPPPPPGARAPKTGSARPPAALPTRPRPADGSPGAAASTPPAPAPGARQPAAVAPGGLPPAATPARAASDGGDGGGWTAPLRALLRDPERVAWTVALPLLLMIAAGAYLLLQRFVDGGQKLAWRGRGRPDDSVVEF